MFLSHQHSGETWTVEDVGLRVWNSNTKEYYKGVMAMAPKITVTGDYRDGIRFASPDPPLSNYSLLLFSVSVDVPSVEVGMK